MQKSILLVEDDADIRDAIAYLLTDEGYEVACASNGREALSYLHDGLTPSLILLDMMMPGMDGISFREAQALEPALASIFTQRTRTSLMTMGLPSLKVSPGRHPGHYGWP